jgi:nicotinate-nucleotide adenylyltransferase
MMVKKIGIFGGSFDPIHIGHLNLAFELMEKKHLNEVWFIPAQINPHKREAVPLSIEHRLHMVQLAIQGIPQFSLKDLESKRSPPSYTIDTLRIFIEEDSFKQSPHQFYLLMGEDAIPSFSHWYLPGEIIKLASLLIGTRSGIWQSESLFLGEDLAVREALLNGLTAIRLIDISSTELRQRLSQNLYCEHLIPAPVLQYIHQHQLYQAGRS